jgi:ABC-type phosphate/phosphonate transport system permease subunit
MRANLRTVLNLAILIGVSVFAAVCFHSVQEIHYLKTFFPKDFTMDEAFHAAMIELIKVVIIGLPILLIIAICLAKLRERKAE